MTHSANEVYEGYLMCAFQVLENGRLIEFDHPHILLQREDGVFASLVAETGVQNSALLRRLAEACYQKKDKRNSE